MKTRSRIFLGALALLALAADSAITWRLAVDRAPVAGRAPVADSAPAYSEAKPDPMDSFRLEREQLRAMHEARLNDIIHDSASDPQIVADAQRQLMELMSNARDESTLEGILQSRGFGEVLVSVSAGSANVLVKRAPTAMETAVILDLTMRQTGLTGGNVKIIPVK